MQRRLWLQFVTCFFFLRLQSVCTVMHSNTQVNRFQPACDAASLHDENANWKLLGWVWARNRYEGITHQGNIRRAPEQSRAPQTHRRTHCFLNHTLASQCVMMKFSMFGVKSPGRTLHAWARMTCIEITAVHSLWIQQSFILLSGTPITSSLRCKAPLVRSCVRTLNWIQSNSQNYSVTEPTSLSIHEIFNCDSYTRTFAVLSHYMSVITVSRPAQAKINKWKLGAIYWCCRCAWSMKMSLLSVNRFAVRCAVAPECAPLFNSAQKTIAALKRRSIHLLGFHEGRGPFLHEPNETQGTHPGSVTCLQWGQYRSTGFQSRLSTASFAYP